MSEAHLPLKEDFTLPDLQYWFSQLTSKPEVILCSREQLQRYREIAVIKGYPAKLFYKAIPLKLY